MKLPPQCTLLQYYQLNLPIFTLDLNVVARQSMFGVISYMLPHPTVRQLQASYCYQLVHY